MVEDFSFDVSGILSDEEAAKLFEEQEHDKDAPENQEEQEQEQEQEQEETPAEEQVKNTASEKVGSEEDKGNGAVDNEGDGSSPNIYSSIASALREDGTFSDLEDGDFENVSSPEALLELIDKAVESRFDDRQKRLSEIFTNGGNPNEAMKYEQTLNYLGSIKDEMIEDEGEDGENLRKQLIYNDLVMRGYSHEKAVRELEKSFKSDSDIDDAKDALESLLSIYNNGYQKYQDTLRSRAEQTKLAREEESKRFRKLVLEDEVKFGDTVIDKKTCQKVFDAVSKPVYKDPDTGALLTQVQKFQREQPLEFLKQLGMWYVLTNCGKDPSKLVKNQVQSGKDKAIKELERKLNTTAINADGTLRYMGGSSGTEDPLLSEGWTVGWYTTYNNIMFN